MVVRTPEGVLLFDCVGYVDEAALDFVRSLGPTLAVAASHPHMYGVQTEWARALGDVPVLVAAPDAEWVRRRDALVELYDERREVAPGLTLHRVGGHFRGQAVVEWTAGAEGRGVLLAGDAVFPNPDRRSVSFMRSYPNRIPLSGNVVQRIAGQLEGLHFDRLYNNFGAVVPSDAKARAAPVGGPPRGVGTGRLRPLDVSARVTRRRGRTPCARPSLRSCSTPRSSRARPSTP